MVTAPVYSAAV